MAAGWMYSNGRRERVFDEYLKALSDNQLINLIEIQIDRLNGEPGVYPFDERPNTDVEQDALMRLDKIGEEKARRA